MQIYLANQLTIFRIVLVPIFVFTIINYTPENDYVRFIALGIFGLAAILDVIDGYVARKYHQESKLGALLDPLADKFLLISAYVCIYNVSILFDVVQFPLWLVAFVICRDLILLVGAGIIRFVKGSIAIKPTIIGKATTFFQVLAVIGFLLQWKVFSFFWYVIVVLIIVSGFDYILKGVKSLKSELGRV